MRAKQLVGLAEGQRERLLAEDIGRIRVFRDLGGMLRMQAGGGQDRRDIDAADLTVIGHVGHAEPCRRRLGLRLDLVADHGDLETAVRANRFNMAIHDASASDQCDLLHVTAFSSAAASDSAANDGGHFNADLTASTMKS